MIRPRESDSGFTLLEVVVALLVFATGVCALCAGSVSAARLARRVELEEAALALTESVADSLLAEPAPADGARSEPPCTVSWAIRGVVTTLAVDCGSGGRRLRFGMGFPGPVVGAAP